MDHSPDNGSIGETRSVLQDWVMKLPLRHQGVLVTALRGCDLTPKNPLDSLERRLTAAIRGYTLNAFDSREIGKVNGSFMSLTIPDAPRTRISAFEHYPLHYVIHLLHAFEVIAYKHPEMQISTQFLLLYCRLVQGLHLNIETEQEMDKRLCEDRIATGELAS